MKSEGLLARAELLNAAEAKINSTVAVRDSSPVAYEAWHQAAEEGHAARARMYPESVWRDTRALAAGDIDAIEPALVFLETDPWCFRSGYVKADLMRYLSRVPLTAGQRERIDRILLHLVEVGDRREFGCACRLARASESELLRTELKRRFQASDRGVRRRALRMIVSLDVPGLDPGELEAATQLVSEEARAQWSALARDTQRGWDAPSEWNISRHAWVRRVARALDVDHYSFAGQDD